MTAHLAGMRDLVYNQGLDAWTVPPHLWLAKTPGHIVQRRANADACRTCTDRAGDYAHNDPRCYATHPHCSCRWESIPERKELSMTDDPTTDPEAVFDEPDSSDVHTDAAGSAIGKPGGDVNDIPSGPKSKYFFSKMYEHVKSMLQGGNQLTQEGWNAAIIKSRAHAGGMTTADNRRADTEDYAELTDLCSSEGTVALFNELAEFAEPPDWIPYLPKPGSYTHPKFGRVVMSRDRTARMVGNINSQVYQDRLPVDAEHQSKLSGACGWITHARVNGDGSADAHVDWTDRGKRLLASDRFKYFSPEWYPKWTAPDTETSHVDVPIGGAITTRPFFKTKNLRPLVASELGAAVAEHDDPGVGSSVQTEEEPTMSEPQGMTEEQAQQFAEMESRLKLVESQRDAAVSASEAATKTANVAIEAVAQMEADVRRKRFTDEVLGRGDQNGTRWFGETEKHVGLLEDLAQSFGETSAQVQQYIELNRAHAEQLHKSGLFSAIGSKGGESASAADRFGAKVKALQASEKLDYATAATRVAAEEPELYTEHMADRRAIPGRPIK